jgi:hypothetical protein
MLAVAAYSCSLGEGVVVAVVAIVGVASGAIGIFVSFEAASD